MTLSHRWGLNSVFTLTAGNQNALMDSVSLNLLLKTFVEAIEVTRKLGVRYLWIDSLCILQSGERSKEDWEKESAQMREVYNHATAILLQQLRPIRQLDSSSTGQTFRLHPESRSSGTATTTTSAGETSTANTLSSTPTFGPVKLPHRLSCNGHGSSKSGSWRLESCTLLWTDHSGDVAPYKQVRTIPTAYQNSLKQSSIAISDQQLLRTLAPRAHPRFIDMKRPPPPMLDERVAHYYGHHGMWNTMVEDYMRCQLTKDEDKLVAIGGVAQFWQMMTIKPDYKAGIWMNELPGSLLWHCEPRPETVYS